MTPTSSDQPDGGPSIAPRQNFLWALSGNVVYAFSQWLVLVLIAQQLTSREVGQFALGLAISGPVVLLASLELRGVQATDAKNLFRFRDYLSVRFMAMGVALAGIAVVAVLAGYRGSNLQTIIAVGLAKAIEALSDVCYGRLQKQERLNQIARSLMLKGALTIAAVAGVLRAGGTVATVALALAVSWGLVLLLHDSVVSRAFAELVGSRSDRAAMWRLVRLTLPLGGVSTLLSIQANAPRYFIEAYRGTAELGVYAALASLTVAGGMTVAALGQTLSPRLARQFAGGELGVFRASLGRYASLAAGIGLLGLVVAVLVGPYLLRVLFGAEFAARSDAFVWLMASAVFLYPASLLGFGITAARRFSPQLPMIAGAAVVTIAACALLVPRFGLLGAAWAVGVAALVQLGGAGALAFSARPKIKPTPSIH